MSRVQIKICGIQPGDNLDFTKEPQVSRVGIVFVQTSPRYVRPDLAQKMVAQIDDSCEPVGVFRNEDVSTIIEICKVANIKTVQLHGNESPEACLLLRNLGFKVWKCIQVPVIVPNYKMILNDTNQYVDVVDAILLDSSVRKNRSQVIEGGSGIPFPWNLLGGQDGLISQLKPMHVWVAGGINPENVAVLLDICNPDGIDISSGVESKGRKSMDCITELLKEASSYEASESIAR